MFDLDGTLAETMQLHFAAWEKTIKELGGRIEADQFFHLEGMAQDRIADLLLTQNKISSIKATEVVKIKQENYHLIKNFRLYPEVHQIITQLHRVGIKLAIVTSSVRQVVESTVPASFLRMFSAIITSEEAGRGKPYPDPYQFGLRDLGLSPDDCCAVENAPLGIKSAKAAGLSCIGIASTLSPESLIQADYVIGNFSQLLQIPLIANRLNKLSQNTKSNHLKPNSKEL